MDTLLFVFTVALHISIVSSDEYEILPPIYKMQDYSTCIERNDSYCKVNVWLMNVGYENDPLWKLINDSIKDKYRFDRNNIHRGICVPNSETDTLESIKTFAELHIQEELKGTNLHALVKDVSCTTKDKVKISLYDKLLLSFFVVYISLIVYATITDKQRRTCKTEGTKDKIITSFSLFLNWKKICKTEGSEDYNNLKSIQGIRFFSMLTILSLHTSLSFIFLYLSNPEEIEKFLRPAIMQAIVAISVFLVKPFFLISSWILTFQIYNIYRDHGKFTVKYAFVLIINRYFRIGICSAVMLLLLRSSWYKLLDGPLTFDNTAIIQESCTYNWWQTLCFMNNYLYLANVCHSLTWYLSVDFQLYIMTVITMYLILKFKLNAWKVISYLIVISCMLYGSIIYIKDMGMVTRTDVNFMRVHNFTRSDIVAIFYCSLYSNWTISLVGILMGIIYKKNRYRNIDNNKIISILWLLLFFGLPSSVIYITQHNFGRIQAAILGSLIKPVYCLGIGIGILGMSHNIGGPIKYVCENKYVVLMSNFTYTSYVFQMLVIFLKGTGSYSPMEFSTIKMMTHLLFFDAPVSLIIGIICSLIFEQPGINLQKIFLPQIPRKNLQKNE